MSISQSTTALLTILLFASWLISVQGQRPTDYQERLLQNYLTTPLRTNNVVKLCEPNQDRTTLVNANDKLAAQEQRKEVNSFIQIDGNMLLRNVTNLKLAEALTHLEENLVNFGVYIALFAVGLVFLIIMLPFLLCCCTCPHCCPLKFCQKPEDEQYTNCELYWPVVVLILSLGLTISVSFYGASRVGTFGPAISDLGCSVSIILDDVLNGNVTQDGSAFFVGLKTFLTQNANLNGNISNINGNFSDFAGSGTSSEAALNDVTAVLAKIQQIPDVSLPYQLNLSYSNPINATAGLGIGVDSTFKAVLGDYLTPTSQVGGLYAIVKTVETAISSIRTSSFIYNATFSAISGQTTLIQDATNTMITSITDIDTNLGNPLDTVKSLGDTADTLLKVFYSFFISFSFVALLGVFLTAFCHRYACRYLMYISCVFLFIIGVVGFILVVLLSVVIPVVTWGCSYLDVTMGSEAGFLANLNTTLTPVVADQLKVCMPFGNGRIVDSVATGFAMDSLNNLTQMISIMGSFNSTQFQSQISMNLTSFMSTTESWCRGDVVDLDATNYAILLNVANPWSHTWTGCNAQFTTDSWVPSNSQNWLYPRVPCYVASGNVGNTTTCTASLGDSGGHTCGGCMDSSSLQTVITDTNLNAQLILRYGATCNFNAQLTNVWTNYYNPRRTVLGGPGTPAAGSVLERANIVQTDILKNTSGGVFAALNTVDNLFSNINTSMAPIHSLTDPITGLMAGLNCLIFGQDLQRVIDILCGSVYYNLYVMRYALGISCYGVLFSMCFIVFTGVRFMKEGERRKKVGNLFFSNDQDEQSQDILKGKKQTSSNRFFLK